MRQQRGSRLSSCEMSQETQVRSGCCCYHYSRILLLTMTGDSCGSNWELASSVIGTAFSASALAPGVIRPWVMSLAIGSACSSTCCVAFCRGSAIAQQRLRKLSLLNHKCRCHWLSHDKLLGQLALFPMTGKHPYWHCTAKDAHPDRGVDKCTTQVASAKDFC